MPTILVVTGHYLPGFKAGGPIRSISNLVAWLGDEFDFRILTTDRDIHDTEPYPGILPGAWNECDKAFVRYLAPGEQTPATMRKILNSIDYDVLYLNSFFGALTRICLSLRRMRLIPDRPTIIAPRGEFSPGALALKGAKKRIYLALTQIGNLYDGIIWQASSIHEQADILNTIRTNTSSSAKIAIAPPLSRQHSQNLHIHVAPDLTSSRDQDKSKLNLLTNSSKRAGHADIVFLSRISPKKNLLYALRLLAQVKGDVSFWIYGPLEDANYWQKCEKLISELPNNIRVAYGGEIAANDVGAILSLYNLLLFPTLGENFGHVVIESLSAGCPVLLSDQTPWRELAQKHVGWDISLSQPERFLSVLEEVVDMDQATWSTWSEAAQAYAQHVCSDQGSIEANRQMFLDSLA